MLTYTPLRHVVMKDEGQEQALVDMLREKRGSRVRSLTVINSECGVTVRLFCPLERTCHFSCLAGAVDATWGVSGDRTLQGSDATPAHQWQDTIDIVTYFDAGSQIGGLPPTSSTDFGLTENDNQDKAEDVDGAEDEDAENAPASSAKSNNPEPPSLGSLRVINLHPNWRHAANAFPEEVILGIARSLSFRAGYEQMEFWKGREHVGDGGVMLSVTGYGNWKTRGTLVKLVRILIQSTTCANLSLCCDSVNETE